MQCPLLVHICTDMLLLRLIIVLIVIVQYLIFGCSRHLFREEAVRKSTLYVNPEGYVNSFHLSANNSRLKLKENNILE